MGSGRRLVIFIDLNPDVVEQWSLAFRKAISFIETCPYASISVDCLFMTSTIRELVLSKPSEHGETAIATPSNSLAYMGAGFDRYLLEALSITADSSEGDYKVLEGLIQTSTLNRFAGYVPVGTVNEVKLTSLGYGHAETLACKNWNVTTILSVPSMVVPEKLAPLESKSTIINTIWNLFLHLEKTTIETVVVPGICTGYGKISPYDAANAMISAFVVFHVKLTGPNDRINSLKKAAMLMILMNKNYKNFENVHDIAELENQVLSEQGITASNAFDQSSLRFYAIDELFSFIRRG